MPEFTHVKVETDDDIGTIRIDRPDQLNALNTNVVDELYDAFAHLEEAGVVVVLLRTTGDRAFVAGADLKEITEFSNREFLEFQKNSRETNDYIAEHPAQVIAVVDGLAYGGGFELALAADMIVSEESATFAVPEVKLGLIPGGGATQRLPRIIGTNKAKELLATGETISADEAKSLGLVNRLAEDGSGLDAARGLAETIADRPPLAVQEVKRVVDGGVESSLETGLSYEQEVTYQLFDSDDVTEGIQAFLEDRDPEFTGS
ncbi:enoyl-CoA hydratase/isomerase family protein [Haloferax marisrubri]|nr:enoyl-CoA hydratase/isomerase family protein [Haloferax marisrubri]